MVTASKPRVGGGVHKGTASATLPNDATTALASGFTSLGYISDAGVTRAIQKDNTVVKAWGGNVVAVLNNGKTETFKMKFIDADNTDVLGLTFGESSGSLANGITTISKASQKEPIPFVIDTILAGNVLQRIVIPKGVVTSVGDIQYVDNNVVGYDLTITAIEDSNGNTAYEYTKSGSSGNG